MKYLILNENTEIENKFDNLDDADKFVREALKKKKKTKYYIYRYLSVSQNEKGKITVEYPGVTAFEAMGFIRKNK